MSCLNVKMPWDILGRFWKVPEIFIGVFLPVPIWNILGFYGGLRGKELNERIIELLDLVDLSDRAEEETRYLSRGMQQKVALAAAMLHRPDVLLLDEPTLGLDVHSSKTIEQTIRKLATEERKTVLLTTHQMALAERLCDQIFVIHQGKKVADGPTRKGRPAIRWTSANRGNRTGCNHQ